MLQQVLLSPGLRGQAVCPAVTRLLPTLRHVRAYGFGSHVSNNDPEIMDREKQKYMKGKTVDHMPDVPGWNERLASDSEAVVKAEGSHCAETIEELQKVTVEIVQRETEIDNDFGSAAQREPPSGALGNA